MPYIKPQERRPYLEHIAALCEAMEERPHGHLNYVLSLLAYEWARRRGVGYTTLSIAKAALNDAAAELQRRKLDPYEDQKIRENGDVFEDIRTFLKHQKRSLDLPRGSDPGEP